ncbi:MAG: hypothetical protein AB8G96_10115 [Phycisphaerales bacterium]
MPDASPDDRARQAAATGRTASRGLAAHRGPGRSAAARPAARLAAHPDARLAVRLAAVAIFGGMAAIATGCQARDRPIGYARGSTNYATGTLNVTEATLAHEPLRSTDGIRVAGFDTDIDPEYWDGQLASLTLVRTFELFEARHRDLEVMQADAAPAALRAFRVWTRRRGLEPEFLDFWEVR